MGLIIVRYLFEHVVQYFKHVFVGSYKIHIYFIYDHIFFAMKIMIEKEEFLVNNALQACDSIIVVIFNFTGQ